MDHVVVLVVLVGGGHAVSQFIVYQSREERKPSGFWVGLHCATVDVIRHLSLEYIDVQAGIHGCLTDGEC